jgi:hypothetical protein
LVVTGYFSTPFDMFLAIFNATNKIFMDQQSNKSLFDLQLIAESKNHLANAAKWARFLAICGMVGIILMVVGGSYMAFVVTKTDPELRDIYRESGMSPEGLGAGMVFVYILAGLLYFFPCLFLLQFANKMRTALTEGDELMLSESFRSLKKTFRYMGVLTIIFLALFLFGMLAGTLAGDSGGY